jgi:acetylornithine deacetylase/succinyl-diaminopimelate desuccinylase-like protein
MCVTVEKARREIKSAEAMRRALDATALTYDCAGGVAMRDRRVARISFLTAVAFLLTAIGVATAQAPELAEFRAIYQELVEINTTDSVGDTTKASEAMAARLRAAGFPAADVQMLAPAPRKGNLVARYRGNGGGKPLLLLAHLDVVEARREDWSFDPFKLTEKDGYFYGRGTIDDKAMAAIFVDTFIRLRREGFVPNRDLIIALTADEERSSQYNGVKWLLTNHRSLIDAEMAINEGGGGELRDGKHLVLRVQTSEKVTVTFRLEVTNKGGHSSRPERDNAIYRLAEGLTRLAKFDFPIALNDTTRAFFERSAALRSDAVADDMRRIARTPPDADALVRLSRDSGFNALVRTTCIATRLEGGHANNALPQLARAMVNCRMLPGEPWQDVQSTLVRVLADDQIKVTPVTEPTPSPPSPLDPRVMSHVERLNAAMFPGALVIPTMGTGASDGRFLRNAGIPTYGVSGLFTDAGDNRTHGRDERIGIKDLYAGRDFLHALVRALASP